MKAPLHSWLVDPLDAEVTAAIDRIRQLKDVCRVAVMPDVHLAENVCVGLVVATKQWVYPQAVGGDIGCGMATVPLDADMKRLEDPWSAARVLQAFEQEVPILKQPTPQSLDSLGDLSHPRLQRLAGREGRYQLGSLGRGNHFLELQADEQDRLWLCVHSGSRAMGRAIMAHHLGGPVNGLIALDTESQDGQDYLRDQAWALAYARLNRRLILDAAQSALHRTLGISRLDDHIIECHHNQVRRETHEGRQYWVHRKGAISAQAAEPGIIPGSMGSPSYHVEGRAWAESLHSSSHGAGRVASRHEMRSRVGLRDLYRQMKGVWFDHRKAQDLRDEAPSAYRDISKVMRAQSELTRITRRLRPILSFKG